jgi:RNA 2',3'-cyclic 3'-phosphodiesterase
MMKQAQSERKGNMDIRCFVAINLPETVKNQIAEIISDLRKTGGDIKWVPAGNVHLTLKFLGNVDETVIPALKESLSKKLSHYKPFYIKIAGIGCFPSEKRPRVIWIGMEDSEVLKGIQKEVDVELNAFGFAPEDRPFSPHLTIGRVRSPKRLPELTRRCADVKATDLGAVNVTGIHIMKSELKPAGAEYSSLAEIPLGTGRNDGG